MALDNNRIAVLVDGDNSDHKLIDKILNEAAKYGKVTVKRVYGDFTSRYLSGWKEEINRYALKAVQKFAYTKGKNSTDTALIIDAMDLLHSKLVNSFCIVSSDSDFTGIANRVREEGCFVMGIGSKQTPESFVRACEQFTYTEILRPHAEEEADEAKQSEEAKKHKAHNIMNLVTNKSLNMNLLDKAFEMVSDEITGLANAGAMNRALKKVDPTFDIRNYGFNSFKKFMETLYPHFEVLTENDSKNLLIKRKKRH